MKTVYAMSAAVAVLTAGAAEARDQIRVVGSSTVFPFSATVIERFAQSSEFPAPIIESTGTGGGMRFFCAGIGEEHPDVTGASRPMTDSEFASCRANGVTDITEMMIGFDGIVLANALGAERISVTKAQVFAALAAEVEVDGRVVANPHTRWSDIDPSLPAIEIEVLGPPPTSGTRDAFVELVMVEGCEAYPAIAALEATDEDRFERVCATMREDGRFIEAGENDNLIVQRLVGTPEAFGIFGFSFLDENYDRLAGNPIDGVEPTFEAILDGQYGVSRSLFVYIKNQHVDVIPGMREFIAEYTSERASGEEGYLADKGLIPLPDSARAAARDNALNLTEMAR